jgi:formate C-acetyltransferase
MFGDSIGATPGKDKNGPTALLNSCLSFDHTLPASGFILNLKFEPSLFDNDEGRGKFIALAKTYFKEKGQQLSITVVRRDELLDAVDHPEDHKNLIVRVGGFSAYFVDLSPERKENVIARTEY